MGHCYIEMVKGPTWSAVMPLDIARLTLSRVIDPTTRLGNLYFGVMNKFRTAVWSALSGCCQRRKSGERGSGRTCVRIDSVIRFKDDEALFWA